MVNSVESLPPKARIRMKPFLRTSSWAHLHRRIPQSQTVTMNRTRFEIRIISKEYSAPSFSISSAISTFLVTLIHVHFHITDSTFLVNLTVTGCRVFLHRPIVGLRLRVFRVFCAAVGPIYVWS
ncbi:unnamed protein product [Sphenostylis stenocarpa]|uniref:Uncharacterized protein n=1 Tax=Sphenostylis stenocarpa TaxID=92480 RepID=A0AA86W0J6_9FABA|nr:unnamed protein product [Sphenostylis stenocarpa]